MMMAITKTNGSTLSFIKSNHLFFRINNGVYSERHNTARHGVSDVQVKDNGEFRPVNGLDQQLFIFFRVGFIHRFSGQHTVDSAEHTRFLQVLQRVFILFRRWFLLTGLQQQNMSFPVLCIREQMILPAQFRHVRIPGAVEEIIH